MCPPFSIVGGRDFIPIYLGFWPSRTGVWMRDSQSPCPDLLEIKCGTVPTKRKINGLSCGEHRGQSPAIETGLT